MPTKEELLLKATELNESKKFQEVINLLDEQTLENNKSAELYTEKARAYSGLNQPDECFSLSEKALSINPNYSNAYNYRGNAYTFKNEYDKAIENYTKAIQLNPDYYTAYFNRANAWYNKKEHNKAIEDYTKTIHLDPSKFKNFLYRGYSWRGLHNYDKAIEDYTQALSLNPNNSEIYNDLGNAFYDKKEYDKAIENYTKAIGLNPDYVLALTNRGKAWYEKGEFDKSIADLNVALQLDPDNSDIYNSRGISWALNKKFTNAIDDFNKSIELNPTYAHAYNNRGLVLFYTEKYDNAIEEYKKALEIDPKYAMAFRNMGDLYKERREFEKAIESYEKAIKINSDFSWLKSSIDELKAKDKKIDEIKVEENRPTETSLYFLVKTIDSLIISDIDKSLLKNTGNIFLQTINSIRDYSFADNKEPVVHYTKLKVADIIVTQQHEPSLRYYNVVYMNDPEEGKIIFDCLNDEEIENSFNSGMDAQDNNIYLGSFLPAVENDKKNNHEDELVMWRTYGKDENRNDAAGCSIIIMPDFFGKDKQYLHSDMYEKGEDKNKKDNLISNQSLYSVLYFDKRDGKLLDLKSNKLNDRIIDLKSAAKTFIGLKTTSAISKEKSIAIDKIVYRFLTEIRYLFKSADYAFENELRVIQYASPLPNEKDNLVKVDDNGGQWLPRRLYIESNKPVREYISKIYLGPKVSNPHTWMYLETVMKLKGYSKMQLKESECKFQ